ncbi:retinitis pigmentosa 1-like 1 protein [Lytechinus pictus]|uniref:retinitis pigmentosa 1-like 1 protein n=1 Tax=Lytechinus pictus TaxID=7653 RepID=UPI0030BA27BD
MLKAWKRKWVVIRPNTTKGSEQSSVLLELYLEKGAYNKTVTSLLLEGITQIKRVISKSQPRAFEFVKGSTVSLTLAGDSETETQEWIEIFKKLLLPASEHKELDAIQGYGKDVIRVTVVPNKDSERLKLCGTYLAGVSRLQVALHNVHTGEKAIEWDLRHMKRFMLPSKGPHQDLEKIACLQISNRSPQGEGEYLLHSPNAKPLVEAIYERLSSAITVKERRSRTSSMLFEIPPKELEQLAKAIQEGGDPGFVMVNADGSLEDETFESEGEKKENGEANTNGDAEVKANGDSTENHVDNSSAEEAKLENGERNEGKLENGQTEELKTDAEALSKESTADETPVGGSTTETAQENRLTANGDDDSPEVAANESPVANSADVTADNNAVSADTVAEEVAHSEKTGDEQYGNSEDAKDKGSEQPEPESLPTTDASAEDSSSTAPVETQDFAAGPIDAEDEAEELGEGTAEVQPRMPPGSDEPEEPEAREKTASNDVSEVIDERTVETADSVVSAERNSEEVAEEPQTQSLTEDNIQVEISTDTQDIETESAAIDESSALSEQSVTTLENNQQEEVPAEEPQGSEPSEESSTESPQQVEETTAEDAVTPSESGKTEIADAEESPASQETSKSENESQEQNAKVSDGENIPTEQTQDGPSQQVDVAPDSSTPTSDEVAQDAKPATPVVETVESVIVAEPVVVDVQEKHEEPAGENANDEDTAM